MAVALNITPNPHQPTVTIADGLLTLYGFTETDPQVVNSIEAHEDLELAVHTCLQIGARALAATQATLDTGIVEKAVAGIVAGLDKATADHVERVLTSTETLVATEDGTIPTLLRAILDETADKVAGLFDPNSRSSAVAVLEEAFEKAAVGHLAATRKALDPDNSDSPLGRWKAEVIDTLQQQLALVLAQVTDLAASLAARDARADVYTLTAVKGFDLEERLHVAVSQIACRYGDLAEHAGTANGAQGSKVGDETVRLNPKDTAGRPLAIVFEAKARRMSMPRTMDELDRALANREAQAAIAVFDTAANAPTCVPFTHFDNKAIVVLGDAPDERLIELAYIWGRIQARQTGGSPGDGLDPVRVGEAIADIQRSLQKASVIRRSLSTAGNGLRQATEHLDAMDLEIVDALARLRAMLEQ
jgi:hypothetical protein